MTCIPSCACGQEEDAFPSVREALRCLEPYGWRRVPPVTAWTGSGWAAGVPLEWRCPPCRAAWDAERVRHQKDCRPWLVHDLTQRADTLRDAEYECYAYGTGIRL